MKQSVIACLKVKSLVACISVILISFNVSAQMSTDQNFAFSTPQKVHVDLKITPSSKEFKAGITS